MYRDLLYDKGRQAIVTTSGTIIVPNIPTREEAFPLFTGDALQEMLIEQRAKKRRLVHGLFVRFCALNGYQFPSNDDSLQS